MIIAQGKNIPLNSNPGTLPDVSGALDSWMQQMIFIVIVKTIVNAQVYEAGTSFNFQGVMQPFSAQQLKMKPEGQTDWKWYMLHTQRGIALEPDMVVRYHDTQYRVMAKNDYKEYGYFEYHLIEDYSGSGPQVSG